MRAEPLLTLALALLLGTAARAQPACPNVPTGATGSQSLRFMTYNAFMTVAPADNSSAYGMSQSQRATAIAARIIKDDPDVVAMQEVDDDDAKQAFVAALAINGPYKHFVRKADQHNPINDSGLMLFSKFPFAMPDHLIIDGTILGSNEDWCGGESPLGSPFSNCNVKIYDSFESNGSDWWQNKGVVVVRALNSCNRNAPFNIATTHTQSKGDVNDSDCVFGQDVSDLQEQLTTARQLIEASFNGSSLLSQPTFMLGDLNLDGNQKNANRVTSKSKDVVFTTTDPPSPGNPVPALCSTVKLSGINEWELTFNSKDASKPVGSDANKGFYSCRGNQPTKAPCSYTGAPASGTFFIDSWAYQTSREDPGQTQSGATGGPLAFSDANSGERDDYVLHNNPKDPKTGASTLCMQYIRRGFSKSANELSDHLSVTADFNFPAPRCSPRPRKPGDSHLEFGDDSNPLGPEPVAFNLSDPSAANFKDVTFNGLADGVTTITNPGNMQWYVIDDPGAYEITSQGGVAYEVFQSSNLSERIKGASVECKLNPEGRSQDCKFSLMQPPYYVRVFGATGSNPDAENRSFFGTYSIKFHRFDCSSLAEACLMQPGVQVDATWPNGLLDPANNADTMFFYFLTERAATGTFPDVSFLVEHRFDPQFDSGGNFVDPISAQLVNKAGVQILCAGCATAGGWQSQSPEPSVLLSPTNTWTQSPFFPNTWDRLLTAKPGTLPGVVAWPDTYMVKLTRSPGYVNQSRRQSITFHTTLSYFRPHELSCIEERTFIGFDDFATKWKVGGVQQPSTQIGDVNGDFETWDEGSKMAQAGSTGGTRSPWPFSSDTSFVGDGAGNGETLSPLLVEDVIDNDNYSMCEVDEGGGCSPFTAGKPVAAMAHAEEDPGDADQISGQWRWRDEVSDSPYYHYVMSFKLRHQRMSCRGTAGATQSDCGGAGTACSTSIPAFASYNTSPRCVCTSNSGCPSTQTCDLVTGLCHF